jgi:hypothetical protein
MISAAHGVSNLFDDLAMQRWEDDGGCMTPVAVERWNTPPAVPSELDGPEKVVPLVANLRPPMTDNLASLCRPFRGVSPGWYTPLFRTTASSINCLDALGVVQFFQPTSRN